MRLAVILLLSFNAFAQNEVNYCDLNAPQPDEFIPSNEVSGNYWTNMLDDHTVMFTAEGGVSGSYQAYDLKEKKAYKLTTEIDPFPVPDGRRIYIHPGPLQFFEFDEIKAKVDAGADQDELVRTDGFSPAEDKRKRTDHENKKENDRYSYEQSDKDEERNLNYDAGDKDGRMWGYYESIGVLKSNKSPSNNYSTYRVLTGEGEGAFKDYKVTFKRNGRIDKVTSNSTAKVMCPNLRKENSKVDLDFDTPILSPNGKEFAITDRETGSTKIISFNPNNGNCKVEEDLGFEAGKVHFNKDGSQIAFHAQSINIGATNTVTKNNRAYLYDRKKKEILSLKVGGEEEATSEQYPVFMDDGRILYQRVKYDQATRKQTRAWVKVDPKKLNAAHFEKVTEEDCQTDKNLPLLALGKLYREICPFRPVSGGDLMLALNMSPAKCKEMVAAHLNNKLDAVINSVQQDIKASNTNFSDKLSVEALSAACPKKESTNAHIMFDGEGSQMNYPAVIGERCIVCHTPNSPHGYIPFHDPAAMKEMRAMGASAGPGQPYEGKTFLEQMEDILSKNKEGLTPPANVPRVPADGPRLTNDQITSIMKWVKDGEM